MQSGFSTMRLASRAGSARHRFPAATSTSLRRSHSEYKHYLSQWSMVPWLTNPRPICTAAPNTTTRLTRHFVPTLRARRLVSRALASRSLRTKEVDVRHSKLGRIQEHHANVFATVAFAPDQTTRHASSALMRAAPSGSISTTTSSQVCHTAKRTQGNSRRGQPLLRRMAPPVHRLSPAAVPPETWPPASTSLQVLLTQTWSASDGAPAPLTRPRLPLRSCVRRPARPATFPAMATMALPAATALP